EGMHQLWNWLLGIYKIFVKKKAICALVDSISKGCISYLRITISGNMSLGCSGFIKPELIPTV
ncbi:MAG TPA: hypothetical protein PLT53_11535, partial [Prolixibacteraceae bacterium]|nr:hypothetical protein [Prolixibacteraceae bacterium]